MRSSRGSNATHQTTDDWDNVCHQVDPTACPTASNTGATAVSWTAEPNLNATIFTGGGSKVLPNDSATISASACNTENSSVTINNG